MEVIDNSNPVKDGDELAASNYTCRLPRDLKIGTRSIAKSKNESDFRLLQACKTQLSSEVIKWKTECLRLQKERDTERLKMEAKELVVQNYARQMLKLQNHLSAAEEENKKLKEKASCMPYTSALEKLSTSLERFHSYPWADTRGGSSHSPSGVLQKSIAPQEDWKEVSQQLLEKMKQEMRELQELSCSLGLQKSHLKPSATSDEEVPESEGLDENVESTLTGLISETVSLKQSLQKQTINLQLLLNKANKGKKGKQLREKKREQSINPESSKSCFSDCTNSATQMPSASQSSRHSDDSFREFFTKQLESCQNTDKLGTTQQSAGLEPSRLLDANQHTSQASSTKSVKPNAENDSKVLNYDKVCPICQTSFDVPQAVFEEHVLDHLEVESASLLDQYVVL